MRVSQKVKGFLKKKAKLFYIYRNEADITFQHNHPRLQRTGSSVSQDFNSVGKKVFLFASIFTASMTSSSD